MTADTRIKPMTVEAHVRENARALHTVDGWHVCDVIDSGAGFDISDVCRLFAAAPEMLSALRDCITEEGAASLSHQDKRGLTLARRRLHAINEIVRAVIEKATGEQP